MNINDDISSFFDLLNNQISDPGGSLMGFAAPVATGKTFFFVLLAEYFVRCGKNVHYFDTSASDVFERFKNKLNKNEKLRTQIFIRTTTSIYNLSEHIKDISNDDIIIIDGLDMLIRPNETHKHNLFSMFYDKNVLFNVNAYRDISDPNDERHTYNGKFLKYVNEFFMLSIDKDFTFLVESIKSRTGDFIRGSINYDAPLKQMVRKEKIKKIFDWL